MTLLRIKLSVVVVFFVLLVASGVVRTTERRAESSVIPMAVQLPTPTPPYTYTGCWKTTPYSLCVDRWQDGNGILWECSTCGGLDPSYGGCHLSSHRGDTCDF